MRTPPSQSDDRLAASTRFKTALPTPDPVTAFGVKMPFQTFTNHHFAFYQKPF